MYFEVHVHVRVCGKVGHEILYSQNQRTCDDMTKDMTEVSFFGGGTCWLPDARASDARLLYDAIEASSPGRASPFLFNCVKY